MNPYQITHLIKPDSTDPVVQFVKTAYEAKYHTAPPTAAAYSVVTRDGTLIACMGIELPSDDGTYQIERTYRMKRDGLPIHKDNGVELVRWTSPTDPKAGLLSVLGAVVYSLSIGKYFGLVEHDRVIHRHCKVSLGIMFTDINHDGVDLDALPPEHRSYYSQGTMKPYLVDLMQMKDALLTRTSNLFYDGL